jgi:cellulase/cellobiase CelA1
VLGQWPGGFQGEVTVHNVGKSGLTGWKVTGTLPAGQAVAQSWSSALTSSGANLTASNLSWNGTVAVGASTAFGFIGSGPPSTTTPTFRCVAS